MKRRGHSRKGGFIRGLTKDVKQYTLVFVESKTNEPRNLGIFSSLDEAKLFLRDYVDDYYGVEPELLDRGECVIFTDENRVVYSTERSNVDAE